MSTTIYAGILAALLSAASWALATVIFEIIGHKMSADGITLIKSILSVILMLVLVLCTGGLRMTDWNTWWYLVASGAVGITIGDTLFFKSLQYLGAKAQVVFFMSGQVLTLLLSVLLLDEHMTILQYLGATILLVGVACVNWPSGSNAKSRFQGIFYAVLSICCFSASSILVKLAISGVPVVTATFWRMSAGAAFALLIGVGTRRVHRHLAPLRDSRLALLFLLNVVIITYGGFLLSVVAIKFAGVGISSVLSTTEPLFVLLIAYIILHTNIVRRELFGALIAILGLLIMIV